MVGEPVVKVNGTDAVCPDVRGDVKIIGDSEDGFRAVRDVEVAQGPGRGVPGDAAGALEEGSVESDGGKMRVVGLGRRGGVVGRKLVPVAADDEGGALRGEAGGQSAQPAGLGGAHASGVVGGIVGVADDYAAAVSEAEGGREQAALEIEHADWPGKAGGVLPPIRTTPLATRPMGAFRGMGTKKDL